MVKAHSSVGIVLYHAGEDALLVVRQFRPAVSASALPLTPHSHRVMAHSLPACLVEALPRCHGVCPSEMLLEADSSIAAEGETLMQTTLQAVQPVRGL